MTSSLLPSPSLESIFSSDDLSLLELIFDRPPKVSSGLHVGGPTERRTSVDRGAISRMVGQTNQDTREIKAIHVMCAQ